MTDAMISVVWAASALCFGVVVVWAVSTIQAKRRNAKWGND